MEFRSAGNIEESIDLLTNLVIGFAISCCAIFNIFGEMPSCPVAFLTFNLFICLITNSSDTKIFERAIHDQLMEFLQDHFHPMLSAFRPAFGCQTALLKIVEDWKRALDDNKYIAAISSPEEIPLIGHEWHAQRS
jgi:hypothetical protein